MDEFNQQLCNERHKELTDKHKEIVTFLKELKEGQQEIGKRLFVDNGSECIQSKINRHDRWIKGVCAIIAILVIPVCLLIIKVIVEIIMHKN